MFKNLLLTSLLILLFNELTHSQPITVSNILVPNPTNPITMTGTNRFATCGNGLPTINAVFNAAGSPGSTVVNGGISCIDPCDTTTVDISLNGLQWNQTPNVNWIHSMYVSNLGGITVTPSPLFPTFDTRYVFLPQGSGCVGQCPGPVVVNAAGVVTSGGGQVTGGAGFYFVGPGEACCPGGGTTPTPCDNYGDGTKNCGVNFNYPFRIRICNNLLTGSTLFVKIKADSDGNTGCWNRADLQNNTITFELKISNACPSIYTVPVATNTPITKTCLPTLNYQTTLTSTCGNGNAVTWWTKASPSTPGDMQIGSGSPWVYNSATCMAGQTVYAQCCTNPSICLNRKAYFITGTCPPPMTLSNLATTQPTCPTLCGSINSVTVTNGVAPYTYSPPLGTCLTGSSYTLTVTDAVGCTASAGVSFTIPPCGGPTTTPISYCQNATAALLTATLTPAGVTAGSTLLWYTAATGGVGSATAPTPSTATVGPITYYVSEINGTVESVRNPLVVTIIALPVAPVATTPINYCQNTTASTLTATGTNLQWYNVATGGSGTAAAPTPSTASPGSTIYYVSQTSNTTPACEGPRTAITVNVTALPVAPTVTTPLTYCQNTTAPTLTATGTGLLWYTGPTGGTGSATAPTPSTTAPGSTTYYVSQSTTGTPVCEGPRAAIVVNITATPTAPIVTTPIAYCQNATATALTATGTNLLWYTTATGLPAGSATAPTPITATAGPTTYYVSQTTNTVPACEGPRAAIVVNITATPIAPLATTTINYCLNATAAQLTATGTNLLWYTLAIGGVGTAIAPTPNTTSPGSTIYYVSQSTTGTPSCEGPRTAITVNVTALPAAPTVTTPLTYCQNTTAPILTATGTGLLWYAGPIGGTGSTTAPTPSTTAPGSTTYYVSQSTTGTPVCEGPRAAIVVNITATPTAPIVTTPIAYCQNATATALTATGTNLLWYTTATGLPAGSATAPTPITATAGPTTYYVSQTTNTVPACEGPRAAIVVNITATPLAPTVSTPVLYCLNQATVALTATGTNLLWYTNAIGGSGSATAPTPSSASSGSTNYYVSQSTNGTPACEGPRALIVVTVAPPPAAPTVANVTYCQGITAIPLTATGTGTILWYSNPIGGTGTATAPTPSTSSVGSTIYYVSQTIGTCESPRASITVTVNTTPVAPTVTTPLTYCQNDPATVLTAGGSSLLWYAAATGGAGSTTSPTPSTTSSGSTTYYVSSTVGICEGPRAGITVNVTATPALPTIITPVIYCQGVTPAILTATGTGLLWYTVPIGGTGTATAPTPSTTAVGSTIYYVSQTINGCEGPRAPLTVTVNITPAAPTVANPAPYCQNATTAVLTAGGTNLLWYTNATGGTGSATAPTPSSASPGSTIYYVSQTVGACEGPRAAITVTINPTPALPTVVSPIAYCQNATAAVLTATGSSLLWYTTATGLPAGTATAPTPSTVSGGSTTYYVSQTLLGCEGPRAGITVNVTATPALPTIVTPITYCQGVTPAILTATGTGLLWYTTPTLGTGSATAPTPSTTAVGSTIYYVSQTINGCEGPRAPLTVTVNITPAAPTVANPAPYCQNATTAVLTAGGTNLLWYTNATGGTGSATAPTPSSASPGSTIYYVSQTVGACEGPRAAITVTINPTPALPTVVSPIAYCQNATAAVLTATGSSLLWYTTATGLPAGTATAPTPSTVSGGSTTYYVSQTLLGCEGPRAGITVNVTATPALPTIVTPITYCQGVTPAILTATGTGLLWYTTPTLGTGSATAPTPSTTAVGSTIYYVSQTINGCEGPRAPLTVTVNITPAAPTVANPAPYCQNATTAVLTAGGTNLLWYTNATGGTGSATAPTPSSASPGSTIYYVSQTVGACEGPRAAITVTINPTPALPTVVSPIAYCQNATAAVLTATGSSLLWYTTATGLPAGTATAPTPSTVSGGSTTYYVSQTLLGCEGPRAGITVNVTATPALPTIVTPITYCQGVTPAILTATGTGLLWYTTPTLGTGSATAPTPSTTAVGSTIYYVSQTINGCEGPRAPLTVTVNITPAAPTVANPAPYCQNATTAVLTAGGTNLLWYTNATGGTGSATAPTPSSASPGSTIYYVSQTVGVCEGPRAAITVTITGTPLAPTVTSPITYCPNDPAIALTAGGTNLLWYNNAIGGTGSATAPTPITSSPGSFNFYVSQSTSAASGNCEGPRALIVVNVNNNNLTVNLGRDTTICEGESVKFTPVVNPAPTNIVYSWRALLVPATTIDNVSIKDATVNPVNNATYILNAKINGCATEDTVNVNVRWKPIVNTGLDKAICLTQNVLLTGVVTHFNGLINSFVWTPPDSLLTTTLPATIANPTKTTLYTFTVTTTKALYGCDFVVSDDVRVKVQSISNPFAGNDTIAVKGIPHQLKGTGGLNYTWSSPSPSATFNNPFIQNAKVTLNNDANIYLKITDDIGCEGKDSVFIKVYEGPTYYVPSAFTPNGDGFNDIFRAIPVGISNTVYFRVFNRLGQLMFETNSYLKGWDGTFKGKAAAAGTYVWMIAGTDRDYKKVEMKGTVILIR
jgi:gliding motility-associated-like protein